MHVGLGALRCKTTTLVLDLTQLLSLLQLVPEYAAAANFKVRYDFIEIRIPVDACIGVLRAEQHHQLSVATRNHLGLFFDFRYLSREWRQRVSISDSSAAL